MATGGQMILGGLAYSVCTVVLILMAYIGDKIYTPIFKWLNSFQYSAAPPLDPGQLNWIPNLYNGLLIVLWLALTFALIMLVLNKQTYAYQQGGF